jgi:tetratricopeptide (TPR) repeat protein
MSSPWGQIEEGVRYQKLGKLEEALAHYREAADATSDPAIVGTALCRQAHLYRAWCKWDEGIAAARRSAMIALSNRLDELYAEALNAEAIVHQERGAFDEAVAIYEIIIRMRISDRLLGITFQNLGSIAAQRADLVLADQYFRESQRCFSQAGYRWGEAFALTNRAALAVDRGRAKEGEILARQAVIAAKKVGDLEVLGAALVNVADALVAQQRPDEAEESALEALRYFEIEENALRRAQGHRAVGDIKVLQGDKAGAARHYGLALDLAQKAGAEREVARIRDSMETLGSAA